MGPEEPGGLEEHLGMANELQPQQVQHHPNLSSL